MYIECPLKFIKSSMWSGWFGIEDTLYKRKKCLERKTLSYDQFRQHLIVKKNKFHVVLKLYVDFIDKIILKGGDPIDINLI